MNRQQKIALTVLIISLLAMFLGVTLILMKHYVPDFPKKYIAFLSFILACGVLVFISRFIKKDECAVTFDERDKMIEKNAHLAGFSVVYLLVILVSYLPVGLAPEAKIPTQWFPYLFPIAVICQYFTQSLTTLIQYGRGPKGEKL